MKLRVVIIDDDKIIRKTLEKYFIELDFEVTVTEDGESAMKLIEENKPELVISDMLIPGTHGIEICKRIKHNPNLSGIKVILMSSVYKRSDTVSKELECNYDIFLEKPFDFNDLVGVMRQINLKGFK
ncbi:MAG: response regulator [Candidatus Aminicenantes bacterium]|nr:response regulator [Candidatus Aminicenantes bacterium]MCK5003939.1 response regulator [Candidatus Aminicenantes bacterium]